jgi:hypothetical protein
LAIIFSAARLALLRAVKLEGVVSIGFSLLETTTHMLGVPPKSSGGATNRCVMSRLTKMPGAAALFSTVRRLTSAPHQHVDHNPATARVNDQSSLCRGPARFPLGLAAAPALIGPALYGAGRYPSSAVCVRIPRPGKDAPRVREAAWAAAASDP